MMLGWRDLNRAFVATTHYPGFDHKSFNLECGVLLPGRPGDHFPRTLQLRLSLHVRYGPQLHAIRPEVEFHHYPAGGLPAERARRARESQALPIEES